MKRFKVGVVGCGNICDIYFKNMTGPFAKQLEVAACADLDMERARAKAAAYGCKAVDVAQIMADPSIDIIVNLTIPKAHFEVAMLAVNAGKHVYSEKPITLTREQGKTLLAAAAAKNVRVANAPDTVLGASHQTCRKLIDDGVLGAPVAATAFMQCHGHESWHPDPEFYYDFGGGPMFDMGPYYLTALAAMLGGVEAVSAVAKKTFDTRTITSAKKFGKVIDVKVPTHVAGLLEFTNGAIVTMVTSFDIHAAKLPRIEVYGTHGSISVPDPNTFGGPVFVKNAHHNEWKEVPLTHGYADNSRGIGIADMAAAIREGRDGRASGNLAYHVLDVMHAFHDSAEQKKRVLIESSCERPMPLGMGLVKGVI
jgi:predicted dehydrogenase